MEPVPLYEQLRYRPKEIEAKWRNNWQTNVADHTCISETTINKDNKSLNLGHARFFIFQDFYNRFQKYYNKLHDSPEQELVAERLCTQSNFVTNLGCLTHQITPLLNIYTNGLENDLTINSFAAKLRKKGKPFSQQDVSYSNEFLSEVSIDTFRIAVLRNRKIEKDCHIENLDLEGSSRFLQRIWRLARTDINSFPNLRTGYPTDGDIAISEQTIQTLNEVTQAVVRRSPNAVIALLMGFNNQLHKYALSTEGAHKQTVQTAVEVLVLLLNPAAPHICAELYRTKD